MEEVLKNQKIEITKNAAQRLKKIISNEEADVAAIESVVNDRQIGPLY